jgi:hypothetical protein
MSKHYKCLGEGFMFRDQRNSVQVTNGFVRVRSRRLSHRFSVRKGDLEICVGEKDW